MFAAADKGVALATPPYAVYQEASTLYANTTSQSTPSLEVIPCEYRHKWYIAKN